MSDSLTIIDNRTGKKYEVPISYGTYNTYGASIPASALRSIKSSDDDFGMMTYDPGYTNTAHCKSAITFVDGEKGILKYRGYSIEDLATRGNFLEVAYLILHGDLPNRSQLDEWEHEITHHTLIHESIKKFIEGFHYDAHPMIMLISTIAGLSSFYPMAGDTADQVRRTRQIHRLIAKLPTISAFAYRYRVGLRYSYPDNDLSYTGNFLKMLFKMTRSYTPDPILEKVLDVLFILHADHEQNCSTSVMRGVGSSLPDPYVSVAAAAAALYGPLHGGANERVVRMLREIGDKKNVPAYIKRVKAGEFRLMGFGHRVYKNYDPRAKILRGLFEQVFEATGRSPLLDVAVDLERIALEDDYFVERKLYPNVDFYSGIIYQAMGFPMDMFPVLFAIPRTVGWLAQWAELLEDPDLRIARPRQIYTGENERTYIPVESRE
ncbi:MAG: citrate synthase [bacterium]|nr:citrate synthase [bacterium]